MKTNPTAFKFGFGILVVVSLLAHPSLAGLFAGGSLASAANEPTTLLDLLAVDAPDRRLPAGAFDLHPILAEGEPAPGREDLTLVRIFSTVSNSSGGTAISALLDDPATVAQELFYAIFVNDQIETRPLPGLDGAIGISNLEINERGTVAVFDGVQLRVGHEGGLLFTVNPGDPAPIGGQGDAVTFQRLLSISRTLNDNDEVGFRAVLSDERLGLFRASRDEIVLLAMVGDPISGSPGVVSDRSINSARFLLNDGSVVMGDRSRPARILVASPDGVTAAVAAGDRILTDLVIESLDLLDADDAGRMLLVVNDHHLILRDGGAFARIVGPENRLQGFQAGSAEFRDGFVLPDGSVYFTAVVGPLGGIFLWDREKIFKVAVDGDRTAAGASFQVSVRDFFGGDDRRRIINFPRPASTAQAVFFSTAGTLVWRRGEILSFDLEGLAADTGTSPLLGLFPAASEAAGGVLLSGTLCCFPRILFRAQDAAPRVFHLPYFVAGNAGLSFSSTVEAFNLSPFPARVAVESFDSSGRPLPAAEPLVFLPGSNSFFISSPRLTQGFARLTVENGARVAFSNTLSVFQGEVRRSVVMIPQQDPSRQVEFVFEGAASELALALTNPGPDETAIAFQVTDSAGVVMGQGELILGAHRQHSAYLSSFLNSDRRGSGRLMLRADAPLLAILLKQSGLHLANVPPLENPDPESRWGFVNLFPSEVRFGGFRANSRGTTAFATDRVDRAELWVGTRERFVQVLPQDVFPPESAASPSYQEVELSALNEAGQVLFSAGKTGSPIRDVFLGDEGGARKIIQLGPDEPFRPSALNDSGLVVLGGSRLTLIGDAIEDVALEKRIFNLSVNQRGDVAFARADGVGLYADGELEMIAEADGLPGVGDVDQLSVQRTAIDEDRRVVFHALWSRSGQAGGSGVFSSLAGRLQPVILSGQPLPGHPDWTVAGARGFELDPEGDAVVVVAVENAQSKRTVALVRAVQAEGGLETLFVADPSLGLRAFFSISPGPDGNIALHVFEADSNVSAWYWDGEEFYPLLRAGDRVAGQPARPGAFLSRVDFVRLLQTGEVISSLELAGGLSAGVFLGAPRLRESVFPLAVQGRFGELQYDSRLLLANRGAAPTLARIELFSTAGEPVGSERVVELAPGAARPVAPEVEEALLGWARIKSTEAVSGLLHLSVSNPTSLQTEIFLEPAPLRRAGQFSSFSAPFIGLDTAAAFVNPFARTAVAELEVQDRRGRLQRRQLEIPPSRQATFLHSLGPADLGGTVRVRSAFPLPYAALRITNQILSSLPIR